MKRIIFLKILVGLITNITYAQLSTNELPISFAYYDINYSGKIYKQDKLDLDKIYDEDLQDEKDGQVYSTAKIFDGTYFVENDSIMTIGNRSHIKYRLNIDVLKGKIELRLYNRSILTEGGYYLYIYKKVN